MLVRCLLKQVHYFSNGLTYCSSSPTSSLLTSLMPVTDALRRYVSGNTVLRLEVAPAFAVHADFVIKLSLIGSSWPGYCSSVQSINKLHV